MTVSSTAVVYMKVLKEVMGGVPSVCAENTCAHLETMRWELRAARRLGLTALDRGGAQLTSALSHAFYFKTAIVMGC